jgi:hypothetical protein
MYKLQKVYLICKKCLVWSIKKGFLIGMEMTYESLVDSSITLTTPPMLGSYPFQDIQQHILKLHEHEYIVCFGGQYSIFISSTQLLFILNLFR